MGQPSLLTTDSCLDEKSGSGDSFLPFRPTSLDVGPVPRGPDWNRYVSRPQTDLEMVALRRCAQRGAPNEGASWNKRTMSRVEPLYVALTPLFCATIFADSSVNDVSIRFSCASVLPRSGPFIGI